MGPARATDYVNATAQSAPSNVAILMRPERWNTVDFRLPVDQ